MEVNEKRAYQYWEYLAISKTIKRLKSKENMTDEDAVQGYFKSEKRSKY